MKKLYAGMTDEQMLKQAQTIQVLFAEVPDDFKAFDEALNEDFALALLAKIDAAYKYPSDQSLKYEISSLASDMKKAWKACSAHFNEARYFIEKAFPGNTTLHNVFGCSKYYKMTRTQKFGPRFMDSFDAAVSEYHTELLAVGYKQQDIDAISTLATSFRNADNAVHQAKKDRSESAQTRTTIMNDVWSDIKTINVASKRIYRTDYARLKQFHMPKRAAKAKPVAA